MPIRPEGRAGSIARQGLQLRTSALAAGTATDLVVRTGGARIGAYTVTVDRDDRVRESNEVQQHRRHHLPGPGRLRRGVLKRYEQTITDGTSNTLLLGEKHVLLSLAHSFLLSTAPVPLGEKGSLRQQ